MGIEQEMEALRIALAALHFRLDEITSPVTPKLYKVPEAAEALRVDRTHIYKLVKAGELATIKLPMMKEMRIPAAALDELVAPERWSRGTPTGPTSVQGL